MQRSHRSALRARASSPGSFTLSAWTVQERIRELEETLAVELPLDMRCSLHFHDGEDVGNRLGLLGGYSFYVRVPLPPCTIPHHTARRKEERADM